jgi:hypothetical protein
MGREAGARVRYALRKDESQDAIVKAIRAAGWLCFVMHEPADLLVWKDGKGWRVLECKTPTKTGKRRKRTDQALQDQFLEFTKTPVVMTPFEALLALGETISL